MPYIFLIFFCVYNSSFADSIETFEHNIVKSVTEKGLVKDLTTIDIRLFREMKTLPNKKITPSEAQALLNLIFLHKVGVYNINQSPKPNDDIWNNFLALLKKSQIDPKSLDTNQIKILPHFWSFKKSSEETSARQYKYLSNVPESLRFNSLLLGITYCKFIFRWGSITDFEGCINTATSYDKSPPDLLFRFYRELSESLIVDKRNLMLAGANATAIKSYIKSSRTIDLTAGAQKDNFIQLLAARIERLEMKYDMAILRLERISQQKDFEKNIFKDSVYFSLAEYLYINNQIDKSFEVVAKRAFKDKSRLRWSLLKSALLLRLDKVDQAIQEINSIKVYPAMPNHNISVFVLTAKCLLETISPASSNRDLCLKWAKLYTEKLALFGTKNPAIENALVVMSLSNYENRNLFKKQIITLKNSIIGNSQAIILLEAIDQTSKTR